MRETMPKNRWTYSRLRDDAGKIVKERAILWHAGRAYVGPWRDDADTSQRDLNAFLHL